MAAPAQAPAEAAAAAAADSVSIDFFDRTHMNMMGKISKTFPVDATWLTVVETLVGERVRTVDVPWRILTIADEKQPQPQQQTVSLMMGHDIPLRSTLRDWVGRLNFTTLSSDSFMYAIPYEGMRHAISTARANITWPLWAPDDIDVYNSQAMGCYDAWRRRRGETNPSPENNNDIANLVAFTNRSGVIKCCNRIQFARYIATQPRRPVDPFFNQPLRFTEESFLAFMTSKRLLPIFNLDTNQVATPYADAMAAFDQWFAGRDGHVASKNEGDKHMESVRYGNLCSQAYGLIAQGKPLADALVVLQGIRDATERAKAEAALCAYVTAVDGNTKSLVQLYADAQKKDPHCDASVFWRPVAIQLTRSPHKYDPTQQLAVRNLHNAMVRLTSRHLWECSLSSQTASVSDTAALRIRCKADIASLLAREDWADIQNLDDVVPDDRKNPHGFYARDNVFRLIYFDSFEYEDATQAERDALKQRAFLATQKMAQCACGKNPCQSIM